MLKSAKDVYLLFKVEIEYDLIAKGVEVIRLLLPESFPREGTLEEFNRCYQSVKTALKEYCPLPKSRYINSCLLYLQETNLFSTQDVRLRFCGSAGNLPVHKAKLNLLSLISEC